MPRADRWSQLKIGLLAFASIIALTGAILLFARVGALHGDTTRVYMVTDMATGVIHGTEVWLNGQKVGLVKEVKLRPPSSDTTERVAITMDILSPYLRYIRKDSDVQIRPGGSLIGSPVVYITVGTSRVPAVARGDTLRARAQVEKQPRFAEISSIGDSVDAVATEVVQIHGELQKTVGEIGALRSRTVRQVGAMELAMDRFSQRATRSRGTLSLAIRDTALLRGEVSRLSAIADSINTAANSRGNIGRFRHDSSLVTQAKGVLASVDTLHNRIARYAGHPTWGDSALAKELQRVHGQLDSLVQDAKKHPFRYIAP